MDDGRVAGCRRTATSAPRNRPRAPCQMEHAVLVTIDQDEPPGVLRGDLAAELGADRARRAGDEHRLAGEARAKPRGVQSHGRPGEQVVHLDLTHLREAHVAVGQLAERRQHLVLDARVGTGWVDVLANGRAGRRWDGDQDLVHVAAGDDRRQIVDHAEDARAGDAVAQLGAVVVEEADPPTVWAAGSRCPRESDARRAGATIRANVSMRRTARAGVSLADQPKRDADAAGGRGAEHQVDQEHGARKPVEAVPEHHRADEEEGTEEVALHDAVHVADAHVAPPPGEEPRRPERHDLARGDDRHRVQQDGLEVEWDVEVETETDGAEV